MFFAESAGGDPDYSVKCAVFAVGKARIIHGDVPLVKVRSLLAATCAPILWRWSPTLAMMGFRDDF